MIGWSVALLLAAVLALLQYRPWSAARHWPLAGLRALATVLVLALLLDLPFGRSHPLRPWIALDVSASWQLAGDSLAWTRARAVADSLLRTEGDSLLLFGDSLRAGLAPAVPRDAQTRSEPLTEAALAAGRPVIVVTDGRVEDPERIRQLPAGSRVVISSAPPVADLAVADLSLPRTVLAGDSVVVEVLLIAGGGGAEATTLAVALDGRTIAAPPVGALTPWEERVVRLVMVAPATEGERRLVARVTAGGQVAANDSAVRVVDVRGSASAVFVSTTPDQDARFALSVLRGTRRGAVQGFLRVAPQQWREDGALRAVSEAQVRRAFAAAPLAILHGDTAHFGAPRSITSGALILIAPPPPGDEYYPVGAGDSPLGTALAEIPWDSLAPIDVGPLPATVQQSALLTRRARRFEERAMIGLEERGRRIVVLPAAGMWRWRFRGGRSADAFDAVWGTIFDWAGNGSAAGARAPAEDSGVTSELLPRRPSLSEGAVGETRPLDRVPRTRSFWWLTALALGALCAEWLLRRRVGLR